MILRASRLFAAALLAGCVALLAAIPALASTAKTQATTVNVTVNKSNDFKLILSKKTVPHGSLKFVFANKGQLPHNFRLCSSSKGGTANSCAGKGTKTISPGATASVTVNVSKPGKYEYLCAVPGHAAAGMKGVLTVK